jgi:hypothetical protein
MTMNTTLVLISGSHVDHGLTPEQLAAALALVPAAPEDLVTVDTVELPPELGTVPCALFGPCMDDGSVPDSEALVGVRVGRAGPSRLVLRPARETRLVTVIAGPPPGPHPAFAGERAIYTVFGGPAAPREPWDPSHPNERSRELSAEFWAEHALQAGAQPCWVNLTPHEIVVRRSPLPSSEPLRLPPSGRIARMSAETSTAGERDGVTLRLQRGATADGLPPPTDGVVWVVSTPMRLAMPHRLDLVSPGPLVRDENGQPVACDGLDVNAPRHGHHVATCTRCAMPVWYVSDDWRGDETHEECTCSSRTLTTISGDGPDSEPPYWQRPA